MRAQRINHLVHALNQGLYEREEAVRLTLLAAFAGESVFYHGPSGVAKSLIARRLAYVFADSRDFTYLMNRFATLEDIFGPVSLRELKENDTYRRSIEGYLPNADVVFLDEIWNAGPAIQNALLTAVTERVFRNGAEEMKLPMRVLIGASKDLPTPGSQVDQLWDQFIVRLPVYPVQSKVSFLSLILDTEDALNDPVSQELKVTSREYETWAKEISQVEVPQDIQELLYGIRERILRHNAHHRTQDQTPIAVSDRRWKRIVRLLRASAYFNDRMIVDALDVLLVRHCIWSTEDQIEPVNTIVREALLRYSRSGRFDPQRVRESMDEILDRLHDSTVRREERQVRRPVEYRGEYYHVADFVDDHMTLIWIGDFQQLNTESPTETDLFFYTDGNAFAYSERFNIRYVGDFEIEINGEVFSLETTEQQTEVEEPIPISEETRKQWISELKALADGIDGVIDEIVAYREASTDQADAHAFVHHSHAKSVIDGMNQVATELSDLKLEIESTIAGL